MESNFKITFPLILEYGDSFRIKFAFNDGDSVEFNSGIYYLSGENGSGKTTFVNMLALIAGPIGKKAKQKGCIRYNGESYNGEKFTYIRAAEIREESFCIFPQKAFFLPVSTRDNYIILNGSEPEKGKSFSPLESPDFLSGGQQQKILMDIVLDHKKPVWFLDEPLTNMDLERRHYFWETLITAFGKGLRTVFFIDHFMEKEVRDSKGFHSCGTLKVQKEYKWKDKSPVMESQIISIYKNSSPESFFRNQAHKIKEEKSSNR